MTIAASSEFRVMTSGAFTAAHYALTPQVTALTGKTVVTASTAVGSGENTLANRLKRGEVIDIVIVADDLLRQLIADGTVLREGVTQLARSVIGLAVRVGAPKPDVSSVDALKRVLLQAQSIGYSPSVSGQYLTKELLQQLGIADQVLGKCRQVNGERVGTVVARGELELGFQQVSELLPIPGIAHITALPRELQKKSAFTVGVAASCLDVNAARAVIQFLSSPAAAKVIAKSGLDPIAH